MSSTDGTSNFAHNNPLPSQPNKPFQEGISKMDFVLVNF